MVQMAPSQRSDIKPARDGTGVSEANETAQVNYCRLRASYDRHSAVYIASCRSGDRVHRYVVVPSKPVCATDIFFDDPALTEQPNLIAKALRGTK